MAACESLQHIFDNPLPEKPTLLESLSSSWNQIKPVKPNDQPSLVEIFGELHFKEKSQSSSSTSSSSSFHMPSSSPSSSSLLGLYPPSCYGLDPNNENKKSTLLDSISNPRKINSYKSDKFSLMNSESLQLCTEGLGSESFDDVEDLKIELNEDWQNHEDKKVSVTTMHSATENLCGEIRRSKTLGSTFPPPISCIGRSGKPWVCFKSYRHDGRFVLKEVRMPSQEFLQARREGGRLKLQFVQPNDDSMELEDEDYEEDEELQDKKKDDELEDAEIHDVEDEERSSDGRGN